VIPRCWTVGMLVTVCACSESVDPVPEANSNRVRWNVALPRELESVATLTPALATRELAVFGAAGRAIAVDAATGTVRWELGDTTFFSTDLGTFYTVGSTVVALFPGMALGVDAASGVVRWRRSGMPAGRRGGFSMAQGEAFYGGGILELGTALTLASDNHRSFPAPATG